MYTCRECERPVNQATEVCPYCGADLTVPLTSEAEKKGGPLAAVLRWGVLLAALWGFLWFVLPERRGDVTAQAETEALRMLEEAHHALRVYADAQGSFPTSLEALPPESAAAVRQAAQRALSRGYNLEYTGGARSPEGQITSFALRARPGHYGYRNFYLDQSGVVRATREARPATGDDPPI
jgi:hypothetical protein